MGASSANSQSNTNTNITISVTQKYRIGRFVCGCFSGSIHSPYSFSLLLLLLLLWASLSSFLVASEAGVVVPTAISNTSTTNTSSGTASVSPTPPASSLLNTSLECDADTCTTASSSSSSKHKRHSRVDHKTGLLVGVSLFLFLFFSGVASVAVIMGCFPRFRFISTRRRHGSEKVVAHEHDDEEEGNRDFYCKDHGENDCSRHGQLGTHDVCRPGRRFTWGEVEKFTSNFSSVIGSGGFSTVYLAQFPNSALGAIKIHSSSERLNRVFKQEMEILMGLEHDNIVKFLGYCDEREEGVLVFEYVPGGNLQEKLHNHKREGGSSSKAAAAVLPWKSRMTIAYQLAQAIEYLHEKCPLQIVHGDIKSSNILLDEKLNCKLCDFGSAKMGFSSTVLPPSSTRANRMMMGSPGYTDPHYLRTGIASKKNDVYSFGVILLELITGKEALSSQNGERLTSVAGPLLKDESKVAEMLMDARLKLLDAGTGAAGGVDLEEVKTMAAIAAMCLSDSATLRPSSSDIVHILSTQISAFLPSAAVDKKF